jgi:peptidoglycan/LPS O-acetylase OafA/YrhL
VLAALVVANFAGMRRLSPLLEPLARVLARPVAAVAGVSFTLYLTHQPLLLMWATLLDIDRGGWAGWWAVAVLVGSSVWLTAQITEKRRGAVRRWIMRVLQRVGRAPGAQLPT